MEDARRISEDLPLSLELGQGSEKRGRWHDIWVKKSGEEIRGKKMA